VTDHAAALERIAEGKGKRDDVAELLAVAEAQGLDRILVTVKRTKAKHVVKVGGRVAMLSPGGPLSSCGRRTVLVSESQVSAYFEVDEIRYWLRTHPDPNAPKEPKPQHRGGWHRHRGLFLNRGNR